MSIKTGSCDWCGEGEGWLLSTGDERSVIQFGKLWCGVCREGSRERYKNCDDAWLIGQIEINEEMLRQHPIRWDGPHDHFRMHMFKLQTSDETWRMKNELEYREKDVRAKTDD